jgi:hypothetical protein
MRYKCHGTCGHWLDRSRFSAEEWQKKEQMCKGCARCKYTIVGRADFSAAKLCEIDDRKNPMLLQWEIERMLPERSCHVRVRGSAASSSVLQCKTFRDSNGSPFEYIQVHASFGNGSLVTGMTWVADQCWYPALCWLAGTKRIGKGKNGLGALMTASSANDLNLLIVPAGWRLQRIVDKDAIKLFTMVTTGAYMIACTVLDLTGNRHDHWLAYDANRAILYESCLGGLVEFDADDLQTDVRIDSAGKEHRRLTKHAKTRLANLKVELRIVAYNQVFQLWRLKSMQHELGTTPAPKFERKTPCFRAGKRKR